jgi:hypothetical protein
MFDPPQPPQRSWQPPVDVSLVMRALIEDSAKRPLRVIHPDRYAKAPDETETRGKSTVKTHPRSGIERA